MLALFIWNNGWCKWTKKSTLKQIWSLVQPILVLFYFWALIYTSCGSVWLCVIISFRFVLLDLSKIANKCLNVRERAEMVERNKKWSPPFLCRAVNRQYLWKKALIEKRKKILLLVWLNGQWWMYWGLGCFRMVFKVCILKCLLVTLKKLVIGHFLTQNEC